jgi:hypothetical protein
MKEKLASTGLNASGSISPATPRGKSLQHAMKIQKTFLLAFAATLPFTAASLITAGPLPRPDHVVIVIMENHAFSEIIGNAAAPAINDFAAEGAVFANSPADPTGTSTGSHGLRHPSQANYLELFSGNNQGVIGDGHPGTPAEPGSLAPPFNTPNLAASLIAAGLTCVSFSENLPSEGFDGDSFTTDPALNQYQRKHNPIANWQAADAPLNNHVPFSTNKPFSAFPTDDAGFEALPTVSIVVPDEQDDMHDGSIAAGDAWLKTHIFDGYFAWAKTHNSVLILTFDEDDHGVSNQIPTIFAGALITPGVYFEQDINPLDTRAGAGITPTGTAMNHYNVLRTVEDMFGLTPLGGAIGVPAITDVFAAAKVSLGNISTRLVAGVGDNVMIGGFIVGGTTPRKVIVRGIGPSLSTNTAPLPGTLQDPVIELHKADGSILQANDNWKDTQQAAIEQTGIPPALDVESALVATLDPGAYTVILSGKGGTSGIGLVEVFDLETAGSPTLLNISTRGNVQTGNDVMIGGLIITGVDYGRVLVRGLGPSLNINGVPVPGTITDPTLDLRDANAVQLAFDDDWKTTQQFEIERTGLAPANDKEASIVGNFPPGNYTVILSGQGGATGLGLIDAFRLN